MSRTSLCLLVATIVAPACAERPDTEVAYRVAEKAAGQVRAGMSVGDVVTIAARQRQQFRVLGYCGPRGALNVHSEGGEAALEVWRGSPSDGYGAQVSDESTFASPAALRAALLGDLLSDGNCSRLSVGFTGGWQFHIALGHDGLVQEVEATEPWD